MDVNACRFRLATLLKQIDQQLTQFLPRISVPTADSSSYASLKMKLDSWQGQLRLILRELSSAEHHAGMHIDGARDLARGNARYRATQSAQERLSNIHALQHAANVVAARLVELLDRISKPTWPELVNACARLTGNTVNSAKEMRDATQHLRALVAVARKGTSIEHAATMASNVDPYVTLAFIGRLIQVAALAIPQFAKHLTAAAPSGPVRR